MTAPSYDLRLVAAVSLVGIPVLGFASMTFLNGFLTLVTPVAYAVTLPVVVFGSARFASSRGASRGTARWWAFGAAVVTTGLVVVAILAVLVMMGNAMKDFD